MLIFNLDTSLDETSLDVVFDETHVLDTGIRITRFYLRWNYFYWKIWQQALNAKKIILTDKAKRILSFYKKILENSPRQDLKGQFVSLQAKTKL